MIKPKRPKRSDRLILPPRWIQYWKIYRWKKHVVNSTFQCRHAGFQTAKIHPYTTLKRHKPNNNRRPRLHNKILEKIKIKKKPNCAQTPPLFVLTNSNLLVVTAKHCIIYQFTTRIHDFRTYLRIIKNMLFKRQKSVDRVGLFFLGGVGFKLKTTVIL